MFSLNETKNGVWKRTILYGVLSEVIDAYKEAVNIEKISTDNLSVFCDFGGAILKARGVVSTEDTYCSDTACVLLETTGGKYYGLFRASRTKTFNTLHALRDHLFNKGYQHTIVVFQQ